MTGYVGLAVGFFGALLQATVLSDYPVLGVHVDLVLLGVVGWAALRRFEEALLWAVLGGLGIDLFSAAPFGASVLALSAAAVVAATIAGSLRTIHHYLVVLAVPVGALTYYLVTTLAMALGGMTVDWVDLYRGVVVPAVAVDAALGPVVVLVLGWLSRATGRDRMAPSL